MTRLLITTIAALSLIVSCDQPPEGPPYETAVHEHFGVFTSPSGNWKIDLNSGDQGITVMRHVATPWFSRNSETTASVSPSEWKNRDGFFCIIDPDDRVWAYDGEESVWILERMENGTRTWSLNFPGEVPPQVIDRLPPGLAAQFPAQAANR